MEISQSLLGLMYVWAVLAGVAWGVSYDVLRLSRVVFGLSGRMTRAARWKRTCRSVVLFSQDVLFGLIGGMTLVLLLYYTNDGQFRGLAVIGMISGFFVYHHTLGRLIRLCTDWLVAQIKRLIRWIGRCLCWPFRFLYRVYCRTVGKRLAAAREKRRRIRDEARTLRLSEQYVQQASCGFGLGGADMNEEYSAVRKTDGKK